MRFVRSLLPVSCVAALLAAAPARLVYPPAPSVPVTDTYFATAVVDPYRNLEDGNDPRTRAWAQAETDLATRYVHGLPAYAPIRARVAELSGAAPSRSALQIAGGRWIYLRRIPPAAQASLVERDGESGTERVLFDPAASATGTPPSIESLFLSHDGSKVAFTTQQGGSEDQTLRVVDVASGAMLADSLQHVGGGTSLAALAWDGDGKGFVHTVFPRNADGTFRTDSITVVHHVLGTDPATDTYVFGRGLSSKAEYELRSSDDGRAVAAFVTDGDGVPASVYVRRADGPFVQVATPAAGIGKSSEAAGTFVGDTLAVVAKGTSPRGRVVGIGPGQTIDSARTLVSQSALTIQDVAPLPGGFATLDVDGGDSTMRVFAVDGTPRGTVPLPPVSLLDDVAADPVRGDVIISYENFTTAPRWYRYDASRNTLTATSIGRPTPPGFADIHVTRVLVPSADGKAKIPIEIVAGPHTAGSRTPTIVDAYGAYGTIAGPYYWSGLLAWLERGGVFVNAMVRGGGEYGADWHQQAHLATKTVSADDLASCARWLGANGYGDAAHLGISGTSAGGLLMGMAITRNPDRYRAVSVTVGILDLLRFERTPNGAFNTPEFGTVTDPAQFAFMLRQSPYQNVRKGVAYPAVLLATGENDPRVDPYNSRKMAAALQADSSSSNPILLMQKSDQGHGIGNSLQQSIDATAEGFAFFASQLGGDSP